MPETREYQTREGRRPFGEWIDALRDRSVRARVLARVDRLGAGLRGDWKSVGRGVFELRIDHGPGYRIYCGAEGDDLVLLLCGGDKHRQKQDIEKAHDYWKDYKERSGGRPIPRR